MNNTTQEIAATRGTALIVVESCIFVLVNVSAFVGNLLVCLAFYRNSSLRKVTNYFVLSLALTDLAMAVLVIPLATAASIANKWNTGDFGCRMRYFCTNSLGGTSLLTMMLLAINRYFRVVRPSLYPTLFSKNCSILIAVSAWVVTVITVIVLFYATGVRFRTFPVQPAFCLRVFANTGASIVFRVVHNVYIAIPSLVILLCNVKIYQTVHQHNAAAILSLRRGKSTYGVEDRRITRMLTVLVVAFYLCWLPLFVTQILIAFKVIGESNIKFFNFYFNFPGYCSSVVNPIVYAIMNQPFRKEFRRILRLCH